MTANTPAADETVLPSVPEPPSTAAVHAMCAYIECEPCSKCPKIVDTPYGEGERCCFGLAEEALLQARMILGGCP